MNKKRVKLILTILFIIINVGVVVIIARNAFVNDTTTTFGSMFKLWTTHWGYLIMVVILPLIALFAEGMKYVIMIHHTTGRVRISLGIKTAMIGKYYDNITPLGSGGQPFQVYYLFRNDIPAEIAGALPVSAFSMMQMAFFLISIFVFVFFGNVIPQRGFRIAAYIGSGFSIFIPLLVLFFSLLPKISLKVIYGVLRLVQKIGLIKDADSKLQRSREYLYNFNGRLKYIAESIFVVIPVAILSFIYQIAMFSIPYFAIKATGTNVDYIQVTAMCVFVYSAIAFLPTPGNSGGAEISFTIIFTMLTGGVLFWTMILWRFGAYFFVIFVGLLILLYDFGVKRAMRRDMQDKSETK